MIITGGHVFIFDGDILPTVTISKAKIFLDLPESSTMDEKTDFISDRVGNGSKVTGCVFVANEKWAKQRSNEAIIKASVPEPETVASKKASNWKFWKKVGFP